MIKIIGKNSYREIVEENLAAHEATRGYQKLLAEAAGCHTSYLSQVRRSHVHLTLDQAANLSQFWRLTEDETEYFLALISFERSSSASLRLHLRRKLDLLIQADLNLSRRIGTPAEITEEHRAEYYSSWHWSAIHVLTGIPSLSSEVSLAHRLKMSPHFVARCLERLAEMGLVKRTNQAWSVANSSIHIGSSSPLHVMNHANWRQFALSREHEKSDLNLSYTGIYSLSEEDFLKLREFCMKLIQKSRQLVEPSREETACAFLLDLIPF